MFAQFPRPWWIAGGWAIDLFLGEQTREHGDIEVAVLRRDQAELREHLGGWELRFMRDHTLQLWPEGVSLDPPIHQICARIHRQRDRQLDVLLNEYADGEWRFRRDARIHRPLAEVGVVTGGLPVLAPEIVLLYKAAKPAPKDQSDFDAVLPSLDARQKKWLNSALTLAYPEHPWL